MTYVLDSGAEGSIHIDSALEYNQDPGYLAELLNHKLTIEARRRLDESGLSRREVARRLNTSVPQLYRLLDPSYSRKSLNQLVARAEGGGRILADGNALGHEACTRIFAEEPPQEVEIANVLIVHASRYGQTEKVAQRMAAMLRTRGHDVVLLDAAHPPRALEWQRFQIVFVGAPVYAGKYGPCTRDGRCVSERACGWRRLPGARLAP